MSDLPDNSLNLRTAEGVVFSQPLAGPPSRLLAWLADLGIVFGLTTVVGIVLRLLGWFAGDLALAATTLGFFIIQFGYAMITEWSWRGQTFGKRLLGIRVVDLSGHRLQFSQIAIRNLLRAVDILPGLYLVGGLAALLSRRAQRLGDLAANTVVVRVPKMEQPDVSQLMAGKFNSLRGSRHLCAQLRQETGSAEASLALGALQRRDEMEAGARVELFRELAAHFREKATFPPETMDGVGDEQFIRNVVDVLYRSRSPGP